MTSKEEDFAVRFATLMADLRSHGRRDPEAMYLIGSLAVEMAVGAKVETWSELKAVLSQEAYASLLGTFQTQGNALVRQGNAKAAYAAQVLAISLVAKTQIDPKIRVGNQLLDSIIDEAITAFRSTSAVPKISH